MTYQPPPIKITIELQSWKDLPAKVVEAIEESVVFGKIAKGLDEACELAEASDAVAALPEPAAASLGAAPTSAAAGSNGEAHTADASAQRLSPDAPPLVSPHADILALLKQDLDTHDVIRILIEPLLAEWPKTRGDPKMVPAKTVAKFKTVAKRRLEFARDFLLEGNHETFPDRQEIYAALGRYDTDHAERRSARANGVRA